MSSFERSFKLLVSKKKELLLLLSSSLFAFLIGLSIWEIYLLRGYWHGAMPTHFDSQLGWSNIPNNSVVIKGVKYSTNSLGFRSSEINPEMKHLVLVGDSVTWGLGVNDDKTASNSIEKKLTGYQVINLGVSGYGLDQSYLNLERSIDSIKPEIIGVIIYTGNDLIDTSTNSSYGKSKPLFIIDKKKNDFDLTDEFHPNPDNLTLVNDNVERYSCTNLLSLNLVGPKIRGWTQWSSVFNWLRERFCDIRIIENLELNYVVASLMIKFASLAKRYHAKLFFVLSPEEMDFHGGKETLDVPKKGRSPFNYDRKGLLFFQNLFHRMNFRYLDFSNYIKTQNLDVGRLYIDGAHYTPKGNEILGEAIYRFILSELSANSSSKQ